MITFLAFVAIEYALGILFVTKLYFWIYAEFTLPHLALNWVTIVTCVLLADLTYYWDHRLMHRIGLGWATHTVRTFEPEVEEVRYGIHRPINSNNPLVVFLHGLQRLGSKLLATRGTRDRLRVLVKPPDWEPDRTTATIQSGQRGADRAAPTRTGADRTTGTQPPTGLP